MIFWVVAWFLIVIFVTTMNKTLFTSLKCPFPVSITTIHMICCYLYSLIMKWVSPRFYKHRPLRQTEWKPMIAVSIIFIVNIVLSNTSVKYNSLALDQMFRCAMPVFTCILEFFMHGTVQPIGVYLSLLPVIIGTMFVCAGDVDFTTLGIGLLFISCTVSSLKGILTKYLLSGDEPLSTFQLLTVNSGFSIIEIVPLSLSVDMPFWKTWLPNAPTSSLLLLLLHGTLAFFLNIANFNAVKEGGPLMMNVVGNLKQVTMVVLSVFLFGNKIKPIGYLGSAICIAGSMWYSHENSKKTKSKDKESSDGEAERLLTTKI